MGILPFGPFGGRNKDAKDTGYYGKRDQREKKEEAKIRILIQVGTFFFLVSVLEEEEASLSGTW